MATTKATVDLDQIQQMFSLPDFDAIERMNEGFIYGGGDPEENQAELYRKWHDAVTHVADRLFGVHGLVLTPTRSKERTPFKFKVEPKKSWDDAAKRLIETINGVGLFYIDTLQELLDIGPYSSARQAALAHLAVISDYPDVYGGPTARDLFDSAFR